MTTRVAIPIVLAALLSGSGPSVLAQRLTMPLDPVEMQYRTYGDRLRRVESVVLKRLDEIRPNGKEEADRARKQAQELIVVKAERAWVEAQMAAAVAEFAIEEYTKGTYVQNFETAEGEVALAKAGVARLVDEFDLLKRLGEQGVKDDPSYANRRLVAELQLKKAKLLLEQAESKKDVLVKYTKEKRTKELQAEREMAKAIFLDRKVDLQAESKTLERIVAEIANPPTPTETEKKALKALDQALQVWTKIVADFAVIPGNDVTKRAAFQSRFTALETPLDTAERAWDDAREERARLQDAQVEMRIRDVLTIKPGR